MSDVRDLDTLQMSGSGVASQISPAFDCHSSVTQPADPSDDDADTKLLTNQLAVAVNRGRG